MDMVEGNGFTRQRRIVIGSEPHMSGAIVGFCREVSLISKGLFKR